MERHAVLRAPRAGQARLDGREVQLERVGILGLRRLGRVEHPLRLGVSLDQLDQGRRPAGQLEVADRLGVDREQPAGRAVFRRHVGDRGPVGQRQTGQSVAVVLDELAHHPLLPQHLGDRQHQIGGRRPFRQRAGQLEADDLRNQHRHRLPQHGRLGLDAADAPAQHAQPVDHRRVRVGADQRVGIRQRGRAIGRLGPEDDPGQVLEVDLVDDPRVRRNDAEIIEARFAPSGETRNARDCAEIPARRWPRTPARCRPRRPAPSGRSPARPAGAD